MAAATPEQWILDMPNGEFVRSLTLYSEPYVKIRLEPSSREYKLPKALLCRQSTYFAAMFDGNFKEGVEQSTTLEEIDGVVSTRSFEMLVQWLYVSRVIFDEATSEETITAVLQFVRLADMCRVTGMEELMAGRIKAMIVGKAPMKAKKRAATAFIVHNACLTSEHIMSAVLLRRGHPVRTILTTAAVPAYLNRANYLSEALENCGFAVDLLKEVQIATKSFQSDVSFVTIQDPLSDARISLVCNE
ncbi:hypothetical protein V500_00762 [Pseudogymnoascus sp. VKM F-4518 (FW-2643)]|nr:hypothetical protein V500_00762 [Pseudogymnoascus sp. VKM F-4518 (FW-2643)]